jgi:ligand-binding SRPBCC domain-containing protein
LPVIRLETIVRAPIWRCFDLSRDIDLHVRSTRATKESAVAGVTTGLIGLGEEVTWQATHLLVRQRLTSRITAFRRPHHFRDSQVRGPFRRLDHDHFFFAVDENTTRIEDQFDYESPLGWLGKMADRLFLERYMRELLETRNRVIKETAETADSCQSL